MRSIIPTSSESSIVLESPSKKIFRTSTIILLFTLLATPIGYFTRILLARSLSPEMYGLFYAILAFYTFFSVFNDFGFGYSVSYLTPKFLKEKNYKLAWLSYKYDQIIELITSLVLGFVILYFSGWLAVNYFKAPIAQPVLVGFSIFFISQSIISAYQKFLIGLQQEKLYGSIEYIQQVIILVGILILVFANKSSPTNYAWVWSIASLITAFIIRFLLRRFNSYLVSDFEWNASLFKKMFGYAFPTLINTSFGFVTRAADVFFLTYFSGLLAVGQYNIILPIVSVTKIFLSPLLVSVLPAVSHVADQPLALSTLVERMLRIVPLISLYFCFFIFLFPGLLIEVMFGQHWIGQVELQLQLFAIGFVLTMTAGYLGSVIDGLGLVKEKLKVGSLAATITLSGGFILIQQYGLMGVVINTIIVYLFALLANGYLLSRRVSFSLPIALYLKLILFMIVMFLCIRVLSLNPRGLLQLLSAGLIYTMVFGIFGLLQPELKNDLKQMLLFIKPYVKWITFAAN